MQALNESTELFVLLNVTHCSCSFLYKVKCFQSLYSTGKG